MINYLLFAILTLVLVVFAWTWLYLFRKTRSIQRSIADFVTPPGENQPSKLDVFLAGYARQFGQIIAMEAKTTIMGKMSGDSRGAVAVQGAMLQDIAAKQSPILSALLDHSPRLAKTLAKNPALTNMALNILAGAAKPPEGGNHNAGVNPFGV